MGRGLLARAASPFAAIFGGQGDPRLGPEENRRAARDAILAAGLTTVQQASQPGANAVGSLATGAMQGQAMGEGRREQLVAQGGRDQIAQLAEAGVDLGTVRQMLVTALASGDVEGFKGLVQLATSMQAAQAQMVGRQDTGTSSSYQTLGDRRFQIVTDAGGDILAQRDIGPAPQPNVQFTPPVSDENGDRSVYSIDRTSGQRAYQGQAPGGEGAGSTGAERINQALGNVAGTNNDLLAPVQSYLRTIPAEMMRSPNGLVNFFGRVFANDPTEAAVSYATGVLNPAVRYLSGAQMTEQEAKRYDRMLFPRFAESESTQRAKNRMRALLIRAMDPNNPSVPPVPPGLSKEQVEAYVDSQMEMLWLRAQSQEPLPDQAGPATGGTNPFMRNR